MSQVEKQTNDKNKQQLPLFLKVLSGRTKMNCVIAGVAKMGNKEYFCFFPVKFATHLNL